MPPVLLNFADWFMSQLTLWAMIGLIGQGMFFMRFFVQWIASEREKKSVVPEMFWYFSLCGGLIVLTYAIHKKDLVFILGQLPGVFIYLRNIYFIRNHRRVNQGI